MSEFDQNKKKKDRISTVPKLVLIKTRLRGIDFLKIMSIFHSQIIEMKLVTILFCWRWLWWYPKDASWAMVGL